MHGCTGERGSLQCRGGERLAAEALNITAFDGLDLLGDELTAAGHCVPRELAGAIAHIFSHARPDDQECEGEPECRAQEKHHFKSIAAGPSRPMR
ncbi:hypothetical protein D3C87_1441370 [compost metagenome]